MSEPFLGEIRMVAFPFAPRGWMLCSGQLLSIAQNSALFSLIGTTFGGDGQNTFALPNYQGRSPVGTGNGAGLTPIVQGQIAGTEQVTLTSVNMPAMGVSIPPQAVPVSLSAPVAIPVSTATATVANPANAVPAAPTNSGRPFPVYNEAKTGTDTLTPFDISVKGNVTVPAAMGTLQGAGQPLPIRNPYLGTVMIIATEGIFPSRN